VIDLEDLKRVTVAAGTAVLAGTRFTDTTGVSPPTEHPAESERTRD